MIAMRGAVKISLNDLNGALLDLNKAIELESSDGYMYYYRGIAKNKLGDNTNACLDLKKAIELGYEEASVALKEICK
jgi:Flp pilus assembly protein TadD